MKICFRLPAIKGILRICILGITSKSCSFFIQCYQRLQSLQPREKGIPRPWPWVNSCCWLFCYKSNQLSIVASWSFFIRVLIGVSNCTCNHFIMVYLAKVFLLHIIATDKTNLLNWCHLASISKNVVFCVFLVVRIY